MKIIIKQPIDKSEWATVFCVGDNACEIGGQLSNTILEKMRSEGIIKKMNSDSVRTYYTHVSLIADAKSSNYFQTIS